VALPNLASVERIREKDWLGGMFTKRLAPWYYIITLISHVIEIIG